MEKMIGTVIVITLGLLVVFILISVVGKGTYSPVESFISIFSTKKSVDGHSAEDFERMIKGYTDKQEPLMAYQVCKWYAGSELHEEFRAFQKDTQQRYCQEV